MLQKALKIVNLLVFEPVNISVVSFLSHYPSFQSQPTRLMFSSSVCVQRANSCHEYVHKIAHCLHVVDGKDYDKPLRKSEPELSYTYLNGNIPDKAQRSKSPVFCSSAGSGSEEALS